MNNQEIRSALQDALEAEVPSGSVRLWPRVKAGFAAGNTQQRKSMSSAPRRIAFAVTAISILFGIVLFTPQGRAFAQRMVQFFIITEERFFQIPTDQVSPAPETPTPPASQMLAVEPVRSSQSLTATPDAACNLPASVSTYYCQVRAAEAQAGFNAKEFLYDPKGTKFSTVTFTSSTGEISMEFVVNTGGGYLYLRQGISDFPEQMHTRGKVLPDAVEQVSVNGSYAELTSGTFVVYPNATVAVWEPGAARLILAWREGNHWYVIEKMGDTYPIEWITKDQLIKLAEGLVDDRPIDSAPPLDPEYLSTVDQAEVLAGFDIPTPSILPAGYELKRVTWADNVVRLMYGPKYSSESELFISLGQIDRNPQVGPCGECPSDASETVQIGRWRGWYLQGIYQSPAASEASQRTPTPIWDGNASHWSLVWNSDTFWFSMFYSPVHNSGKETNKETLIKIAESLK